MSTIAAPASRSVTTAMSASEATCCHLGARLLTVARYDRAVGDELAVIEAP